MSATNRIVSLLICDDHKLLTDALATDGHFRIAGFDALLAD